MIQLAIAREASVSSRSGRLAVSIVVGSLMGLWLAFVLHRNSFPGSSRGSSLLEASVLLPGVLIAAFATGTVKFPIWLASLIQFGFYFLLTLATPEIVAANRRTERRT